MSEQSGSAIRGYDAFKAFVALALLLAIFLVGAASSQASGAEPIEAAPVTPLPLPPIAPAIESSDVAAGCISVQGSGPAGEVVEVRAGESSLGTATAGADGQWTLTVCVDPGEYRLMAVTVDSSGGEVSQSATVAVLVPAPPTSTVVPATSEPQPTAAEQPTATAAVGEGEEYVVQPGDWLMGLAREFYGDPERWVDIYEFTNAMAESDPSFATIADPSVIEPGWKLWIPTP